MKAADIAALFGIVALTQFTPTVAHASDPHIKLIAYDAGAVIRLTGALGWQIMIEMAEDERIENVSIGDSTAWQITPNKRARMLFVRPLSRKASTNMTVITTQRSYVFDLAVGPRQPGTPWIVRFAHPPALEVVQQLPPPPVPVELDFNYTRAGDASLLPSRVWDDGHQTYFEFAEETAMPAIFAGAPGKDEALVNVSVRGRIAIVQQRAAHFTLRAGKRLASVTRRSEGAPDAP